MKKILMCLLCLGMIVGCSKKDLQSYKEIKLEEMDNFSSADTSFFDKCEIEQLTGSLISASNNEEQIRIYYSENDENDERIIEYQINFDKYGNEDNDTATYLKRVLVIDLNEFEYSGKYFVAGRNGLELDLETNEKYERSDTIGDLSEEDKISLLEVKEYYNEFVEKYNMDVVYAGNYIKDQFD